MITWTAILDALAGLIALLVRFFIKTPEQKAAEDLQKAKDHADELAAAIKKAQGGDPVDLSKLINK